MILERTIPVSEKNTQPAAHRSPVPAVVPRPTQPAAPPSQPAPRKWIWAVFGAAALGIGGLLYFQPWIASIPEVAVEVAALGPVARVLAINGRVASEVSVDVVPLVSGTLVEVAVVEGQIVRAGDVLALVDPATSAAMARQALAGLDAALVAQADAQATYDRTDALGPTAARVVLESAARSVQAAAQEVARMTALLEQAQIQFAKFTIAAPIAGTVLALRVEPGQTVDQSSVLLTIADLGQLVVETDVDESYATQIRLGQGAALQLAGETEVRSGRVSFVSQRVDETTGGLAIKLVPDAYLSAPVGLTVTANITVDARVAAITVPRAALFRDGVGDAVFVAANGLAVRRTVVIIEWPAARLIVTDGLVAGDIVINDAAGIVDGQAVKAAP
jgi:RND family efflux transporter MFP subunit